ncbi:MAG: 2Fe-2S iron-sulfur cluster-binding protein [Pseudomonadota bacterium]|nr:2Fe-2S iron-sulfur cluster-binding protein [Pseudomonadota bacterium]
MTQSNLPPTGASVPDPDANTPASAVAPRGNLTPLTRRGFMQSAAVALGGVAAPGATVHAATPIAKPGAQTPAHAAAPTVPVVLKVNGKRHELQLEPRVTLLDALREYLDLNGTKKGCDRGQCGACTVLLNGKRINSCLTLAVMHDGDDITTVEGLAQGGELSAVQTAFTQHDAFQCGYCTPGQICSATALLTELKAGTASAASPDVRAIPIVTDAEIRERMSGNLCRCGAYPNIVAAIRSLTGRSAA